MTVERIRLGPFVGGLNTFSDPTAIGDTEVAELINLELDIDGSLVSRPPITQLSADSVPGSTGFGIDVLGFFETTGGAKYLIVSNRDSSTYYFDGTSFNLITNTFAATAAVQYRDEMWLVAHPDSVNPGGKWSIIGGFTADADMPKGGCAAVFKDRIWIGPGAGAENSQRLYLSAISAGAVDWPTVPLYIQVGAGDGQSIVDVAVYLQSLLIFKQGSTYRYAFSSDPSLGELSRISDNIGAVSKNCYASYQNSLYVLFDNKVYSLNNYNYDQLNVKVPLRANNPSVTLAEYTSISVWSDRLFVQYYDVTYVYSLKTRTWSVWESSLLTFMGRFILVPGQQGNEPLAFTYRTAKSGFLGIYQCKDVIGTDTETMTCTVATKNYDYQSSDIFKRLLSWVIDAISKVEVTGEVRPVTYSTDVTWNDLVTAGVTWDMAETLGYTWDRPMAFSVVITDAVSTVDRYTGRKAIKFLKSLYFRQVSFKITAETDGSSSTAPFRLFNIMTRVSEKNYVSKRVN